MVPRNALARTLGTTSAIDVQGKTLKAARAVAKVGRLMGLLALLSMVAACVVVQEMPHRRPQVVAPRAPGFSASERRIVQAYYAELHRRGGCPPGLAKKHNGCQPPGQAKTRYVTGRPLSRGVAVLPLPRELAVRIGRPPRGYYYGVVNGDVVKLVVGSLLVIDAITGLGG